jgi:hypothetical protein
MAHGQRYPEATLLHEFLGKLPTILCYNPSTSIEQSTEAAGKKGAWKKGATS